MKAKPGYLVIRVREVHSLHVNQVSHFHINILYHLHMNMNSLQCCCWHRGVVLHLCLLRKGYLLFSYKLLDVHTICYSASNEHTHWGRCRLRALLPRFPLKLCGDVK